MFLCVCFVIKKIKLNTKIKENRIFGQFEVDEVELNEEWNEDEYGYWKKADTLRRTGQDAAREKRPKGWFPIFITTNNEIYVTENDEPLNTDDFKLLPCSEEIINEANLLMLEMIKAYDKSKNDELLVTAKK